MNKKCLNSNCGKTLSLSEFYMRSNKPEAQCKSCRKKRTAELRAKRSEHFKKYEKERSVLVKRRKHQLAKAIRHRETNIFENSARRLFNAKIKNGEVVKKDKCQNSDCCRCDFLQAHHHDYNKPFEVIWLCPSCHTQYHVGTNNDAENIRKIINKIIYQTYIGSGGNHEPIRRNCSIS